MVFPVKFGAYAASADATQAEIAAGLTNNFNKNFQREKPKLIKAEVVLMMLVLLLLVVLLLLLMVPNM